jgi:hypothetical protein
MRTPAGITGKPNGSASRAKHEPAPERPAAVPRPARAPVLGRGTNDLLAGAGELRLPPIELRDVRDTARFQPGLQSQRHNDQRPPVLGEPAQAGQIEMVIVIVAQQHHVHAGQFAESKRGRLHAPGSEQTERPGPGGEDRIGESREAGKLQEVSGMTDERGGHLPGRHMFRQNNGSACRHRRRPRLGRAPQPLPPPSRQIRE